MGKARFFLGDVGAGANMKLVVNMVMGSMMVAFAEGMTLADKVGVTRGIFLLLYGGNNITHLINACSATGLSCMSTLVPYMLLACVAGVVACLHMVSCIGTGHMW